MSLSASTLWMFLFLIPGLVFRFFLYYKSLIFRPLFGGNPIYGSVMVVLLSAIVHWIAAWIAILITSLIFVAYEWDAGSALVSVKLLHAFFVSLWEDYTNDVHYFFAGAIYLVYSTFIGYWFAAFFRSLADRRFIPRRMLYDAFTNHIDSSADTILTAFVLTKVSHDGRRLMYAGVPKEIGLGEGAKIAYIVIKTPVKFYLKLDGDQPKSTFENFRPIGDDGSISSIFISAEDTENIHLESWSFPDEPAKQV